ncbi:hypothetical protein MRX96_050084 [Rhipicephalus microplus]
MRRSARRSPLPRTLASEKSARRPSDRGVAHLHGRPGGAQPASRSGQRARATPTFARAVRDPTTAAGVERRCGVNRETHPPPRALQPRPAYFHGSRRDAHTPSQRP